MWQNACVNTVKRAMVCDVYFSFSKTLLHYEMVCAHIHVFLQGLRPLFLCLTLNLFRYL